MVHYGRQAEKIRNFASKLIDFIKITSETFITTFGPSYKQNLRDLEDPISNITDLKNSNEEYLLGRLTCTPQKIIEQ